MANGGTSCSGRRVRAGDNPDDLADKIKKGKAVQIMEFPIPAWTAQMTTDWFQS